MKPHKTYGLSRGKKNPHIIFFNLQLQIKLSNENKRQNVVCEMEEEGEKYVLVPLIIANTVGKD